jgi:nicotinate-nucleotide--dimethylbenzimidazole phosphoribosyltransferase
MPSQSAVVAAHDSGDAILSPPGALGVLDRAVDKVLAVLGGPAGLRIDGGTLVVAAADHPVRRHGVSAYDHTVTRSVAEATVAGRSVGAVAAASAGLDVVFVDAGVDGDPVAGALCHRPAGRRSDLVDGDALSLDDARTLLDAGAALGRSLVRDPPGRSARPSWLVALGEVGIGNTTVAAALAAALLGADPGAVVGLGAGADSAMVDRKREVVASALGRVRGLGLTPATRFGSSANPLGLVAALGGPEIVFLAGVTRGVAEGGGVVVLDGLATSVAALVAVREEPAIAAHLIAGQRSRESGHRLVLEALGQEPLLDLRLRAGEGAGASLAAGMLKSALRIRTETAQTV